MNGEVVLGLCCVIDRLGRSKVLEYGVMTSSSRTCLRRVGSKE